MINNQTEQTERPFADAQGDRKNAQGDRKGNNSDNPHKQQKNIFSSTMSSSHPGQLALFQMQHSVGKVQKRFVVGYHHHKGAFCFQFNYIMHHHLRAVGVKVACGLVAEKYLWLQHHCPCNSHPLLLTAAELCRQISCAVGKVHLLQRPLRHKLPLGAGHFFVYEAQLHVLLCGEGGYQIVPLKDKCCAAAAQAAYSAVVKLRYVLSADFKAAAVKGIKTAQNI